MFYKPISTEKAIGTGAGLGLAYLLTGNFWYTLFGSALGYLIGGCCEETTSVKSIEQAYPQYKV